MCWAVILKKWLKIIIFYFYFHFSFDSEDVAPEMTEVKINIFGQPHCRLMPPLPPRISP